MIDININESALIYLNTESLIEEKEEEDDDHILEDFEQKASNSENNLNKIKKDEMTMKKVKKNY